MTTIINEEINVNAFYFRGGQGLRSFPRQIEWNGQFITFVESGLRLLVQSGHMLAELFDMNGSDGQTYRLRHEADNWTLVGIRGGN